MRGKATLVRFADDFVMTFETCYDAKREQRRPRTLSADERTRLLALGADLRNV
jgi:hypothetical protein